MSELRAPAPGVAQELDVAALPISSVGPAACSRWPLFALIAVACSSAPRPSRVEHVTSTIHVVLGALPPIDTAIASADCRKVAGALRGFAAAHTPDLDDLARLITDFDEDEARAAHDVTVEYIEQMQGMYMRVDKTCPGDADVKAAMHLAGG